MSDTCVKHSFETAAGVCRQCRNSYCSECLVFAFGENKPPYCVTCALNVAGVRHQGAKVNPRVRKRGWFGRKTIVEDEPRVEKGFDDIQIEFPDTVQASPVMTTTTRRSVSPEVLAMVQAAETDYETSPDTEVGGVAVAAPPVESGDSLADWAASLEAESAGPLGAPMDSPGAAEQAWPESTSGDAWPDDSMGRL